MPSDNNIGSVAGQATPLTYGQKAVGVTFNPSGSVDVSNIKALYAEIIDVLNNLRTQSQSVEQSRLYSIAITEAQGAQMFAVKGITWQD